MEKFKTVEVLFKDNSNNYKTSVNGASSDESLKKYFVNTMFNLGAYPKENLCECIGVNIT